MASGRYSVVTLLFSICFLEFGSCISNDPNDITFYLYPNPSNPLDSDELVYQDVQSILDSRYDPTKNLIIYASGFLQNRTTDQAVKNAYLAAGYATSSNVIIIDYGPLSGNTDENPLAGIPVISNLSAYLMALPLYIEAAGNVPIVGQRLADFITFLDDNDLLNSADKVHIIGQSLGAHVCGIAGSSFIASTGSNLGRITGTDPAGPLFQLSGPSQRLDSTDATFVDIVHTNAGGAGYVGTLGDVDVFVNSIPLVPVQIQPTCLNQLQNLFCSHNLALVYFANSVINQNLVASSCQTTLCSILGQNTNIPFGEPCPRTASGTFYISLSPN